MMNINNSPIQEPDTTSYFNNHILNPFLDKSKIEYPNFVVESDSNMMNILLLKEFPKQEYNFKYENAINSIGLFLKRVLIDYGLYDSIVYEDKDEGFNPSFQIKVPKTISSKELNNIWEDIFRKVNDFADSENISFIMDDLSIILCR